MRRAYTWGSELKGKARVQEGGLGWELWCTPVMPAFRRLGEEDCDGLDYSQDPVLQNKGKGYSSSVDHLQEGPKH